MGSRTLRADDVAPCGEMPRGHVLLTYRRLERDLNRSQPSDGKGVGGSSGQKPQR